MPQNKQYADIYTKKYAFMKFIVDNKKDISGLNIPETSEHINITS